MYPFWSSLFPMIFHGFIKSAILWLIATPLVFSAELWVDAVKGDDQQDGQSATTALRTLTAAANLAKPGTTVKIQPGIYRESVQLPKLSNNSAEPLTFVAAVEGEPVIVRGSESAATLKWNSLTENEIGLPTTATLNQILWADVSKWNLTTAPRFIVQLNESGEIATRFTLAREPDQKISTEWKQHEYWWRAEGGNAVASCNPTKDRPRSSCDEASRSLTQLTDHLNDTAPEGIESGNLTTLGDLTGATLVAVDTVHGYFVYRRTITAHEIATGRVTVDRPASFKTAERAGLGWGSKYYVENHPALLDQPGEYWLDQKTQRLYLWLPQGVDLERIEIARHQVGWDFNGRSYVTLEGLTFELFNDIAIVHRNTEQQRSYNNQLRHLTLRYANRGLVVEQTVAANSAADMVTTGLRLEDSEISEMDSDALFINSVWDDAPSPTHFTHAPIKDTIIRNNQIHHIGFASTEDRQATILVNFPDQLRFEDNHIHHTAYDGIQLYGSVIQSDKNYDFLPQEIKTGQILLKNNVIEKTCQLIEECGGIKVVGTPPQHHVFREFLITGNTLRFNRGWSDVAQQRNLWASGYFGFGVHLSEVSGIHIYRNTFYNHSWAHFFSTQNWRDGEIVISHNLFANAPRGIDIWNSLEIVTHKSVGTQITNNILVNHENFGIVHTADLDETPVIIDYNLYYSNGWGTGTNLGVMKAVNDADGGNYSALAQVRAKTIWEAHGIESDPSFRQYDYSAQALAQDQEDLTVDFRLNRYSPAIDRGTALAPSLITLLDRFAIKETVPLQGSAWDLGAFEFSEKDFASQGSAIDMATTESATTTAQFNSYVTTLLSGSGNDLTIAAIDTVKVAVDVFAAPEDVGQLADLMIVAGYTPTDTAETLYFMRQGSAWLAWDGQIDRLTTASSLSALPEQLEVVVYEGELTTMPGSFTVYVGYLSRGLLNFNGIQPIKFVVLKP